ncbi:MAG: pyridoxal phosphate-dependent aminotransferase [Lentisphaeraceae bacterium]|nr:pyridoxal phosphate-dependent aminotransferase [Lentisphaeraceae bacterium]
MKQLIASDIAQAMANASWIRRMFEAGLEMKQRLGAKNVFDFSLGNPDVPPPAKAREVLHALADDAVRPCGLGYMPNAGLPAFRVALAEKLTREQGVALQGQHLIVTVGAAGALVTFFRTVLEASDEVVVPAPYFVEYGFYCGHFGGKLRPVPMQGPDFALDVDALLAAVTERTRVILLNSPNNPTGAIYSADALARLAKAVNALNETRTRPIFILSDEPYRLFAFDGATVPPVLALSPYAVVLGSFSKSLSLAGERIGYIAVNPALDGAETLLAALTMTNRTLGYVNAPILGQKLALGLLNEQVDLSIYDARRQAMARVLNEAGLTFALPRGAFYFFPQAPGGDDVAFCNRLLAQGIIAVPGRGFGMPGYIRLCCAVELDIIERSAEAWKRAMQG